MGTINLWGTTPVEPQQTPEEGYAVAKDMTGKAIS